MVAGLRGAVALNKKLQNRGEASRLADSHIHSSEYIEPTNILSRKRGGKRPRLTTGDRIKIVHQVLH